MSPSSSRSKILFKAEDSSEIASLWRDRFGIPLEAFANISFYRRAKNVWAFSDAVLPNLSYESIGLRMMNFKEVPWKPTSCALQVFGRYATKNILNLTLEQAETFMTGRSFALDAGVDGGYVVVFYKGAVLGCGLYSHGRLISQLPSECRISGDEEIDL